MSDFDESRFEKFEKERPRTMLTGLNEFLAKSTSFTYVDNRYEERFKECFLKDIGYSNW